MIDISIIIVNYRSEELLANCLSSFANRIASPYEIIVVDNSSSNTIHASVSGYEHVKVVDMGYNAGFARANNFGMRMATGKVLLLLNPDTLLHLFDFDSFLIQFNSSPYIGAGVQLQNLDGTAQISGSFFITGGVNNLLPLPVTGKLIKYLGNSLGVKKTSLFDSNAIVEVDWINGAFLAVKRTAVDSAGMLDEDFFLYAEEIEWCSRLRKQGKLAVFGSYKVVHLEGGTANETFQSAGKGYHNLFDKKGLQLLVSNFLRIRKQFGVVWLCIHLLIYTAEVPLLFFYSLLRWLITGNNETLVLWKHYTGNLLKLYQLLPKMITNKPYFYKML